MTIVHKEDYEMAGVVLVPILAAVLAELITGSRVVVSVAFAAVIALEVVLIAGRARARR